MTAQNIALLSFAGVAALYPAAVIGFRLLIALRDFVEELREDSEISAALCTLLCYPALAVFLVVDTAFNWTWGSFFFGELPREFLFTARVERHYRTCAYEGPSWAPTYVHAETTRQHEAVYWADWLNDIDPHHVTLHITG